MRIATWGGRAEKQKEIFVCVCRVVEVGSSKTVLLKILEIYMLNFGIYIKVQQQQYPLNEYSLVELISFVANVDCSLCNNDYFLLVISTLLKL